MSLIDRDKKLEAVSSKRDPSYFDIPYGRASANCTLGTTVITTTGANYWGCSILTTSAGATVRLYDSTGTTAGNFLHLISVAANTSAHFDFVSPVIARLGIVVNMVNATGAQATVVFTPKG